jgi:chemotaxis protein methyltransferase CheR
MRSVDVAALDVAGLDVAALDVAAAASTVGWLCSRDSMDQVEGNVAAFGQTAGPPVLVLSDAEARALATMIYDQSGIVLTGDKKSLIASRLQKRLRALGLRSFRDYLRYLQQSRGSEAEIIAMVDEISTNKTEFFREHQHFDYLVSNVLPSIARSDWTVLNFWSAGCSTGEEPYTLAMVLAAYFGATRCFSIYATDLCTQALGVARRAVYANALGASIPAALRQKYTLSGSGAQAGRFRIVPELRERVTFDYGNLIAPDWQVPGVMNVVFCRNVMIYFDLVTRSRIVTKFRRHLKPDGHLFIGHSESLNGIDRSVGFVQVRPTVYALQPPMPNADRV